MGSYREVTISGCSIPESLKIYVNLREPKRIGLDLLDHHPCCKRGSLSMVRLKVSNRDGVIIVDGLEVADVHLECSKEECYFHIAKKRILNCSTSFPVPDSSEGQSVCFAQANIDRSLPPEVILVPTEAGFWCNQNNCPYNRRFLSNSLYNI